MKTQLYLLLVLFGFSWTLSAQKYFPDRCIGKWKGVMYISRNGIVKDSIKMQLSIASITDAAIPSWSWKTEAFTGRMPVTKNYVLRLKDAAKNWYTKEEGVGVELQDYFFGNKLYSVFETSGVMLTSTYELLDNKLISEVTSGKKIIAENNGVINYSVDNLQRVVFSRE